MQLANVVRQIESTDIANLQMFTEVGKLAIDGKIERKPFQDFIFLIRDYEHGKYMDLSYKSGKKFLSLYSENPNRSTMSLQNFPKKCYEFGLFSKI